MNVEPLTNPPEVSAPYTFKILQVSSVDGREHEVFSINNNIVTVGWVEYTRKICLVETAYLNFIVESSAPELYFGLDEVITMGYLGGAMSF